MAAPCRPPELFLRLLQLREECDRVSEALLGGPNRCFESLSHRVPTLEPSELGFLRSITYLFALYSEAGRVSVRFLTSFFDAYGIDGSKEVRADLHVIVRLRAFLQHNLDITSASDLETLRQCEDWLEKHCGSRVPAAEAQWADCLCGLLSAACRVMEALTATIRAIEADESRKIVIDQWKFALDRFHPPEVFDPVIVESATDIGYAHIDVVKFRKRFYDRWSESLRALDGGYDFRREARRLIERALLSDFGAAMPLTGKDILEAFAIPPGPEVRRALELATRRFAEVPSTKEDLLEHLRASGFPAPPA